MFAPNSAALFAVQAGESPHTKIYLKGDTTELNRWHAACAAGETASNHYLSNVMELVESTQYNFNPLHVFAEFFWTTTALVVNLNAQGLEDKMRARMSSFLKRERPLGKILLVLDHQQQQ